MTNKFVFVKIVVVLLAFVGLCSCRTTSSAGSSEVKSACVPTGQGANDPRQCCSGYMSMQGICLPGDNRCVEAGQGANNPRECCSGYMSSQGICLPNQHQCIEAGQGANNPRECCSGYMSSQGICLSGECRQARSSCRYNNECCSKLCSKVSGEGYICVEETTDNDNNNNDSSGCNSAAYYSCIDRNSLDGAYCTDSRVKSCERQTNCVGKCDSD